jgi:hypothetical protein
VCAQDVVKLVFYICFDTSIAIRVTPLLRLKYPLTKDMAKLTLIHQLITWLVPSFLTSMLNLESEILEFGRIL